MARPFADLSEKEQTALFDSAVEAVLGEDCFHRSVNVQEHPVIALGGAHISTAHGVCELKRLINSIHRQTRPCPTVLSISSEEAVQRDVESLSSDHGISALTVLHSPSRLSQFRHYVRAAKYAASAQGRSRLGEVWVIFTDHDDEWHPRRVETVAEEVLTACSERGDGSSCSYVCFPCEWVEDGKREMTVAHNEYWSYAVRFPEFEDFLARLNARQLDSPYCDLLLVDHAKRFVVMAGDATVTGIQWPPDKGWIYRHFVDTSHPDTRGQLRPQWLTTDMVSEIENQMRQGGFWLEPVIMAHNLETHVCEKPNATNMEIVRDFEADHREEGVLYPPCALHAVHRLLDLDVFNFKKLRDVPGHGHSELKLLHT
eukprot:TRINITY_DN7236_c0_g1_i1.p1 TRINITY_DN7236_c0_g1~~TRINITY_DN7236_c0_g1_i1.p1  ORF type:complete len:371 (-),score=19.47 TRINITY_DN7236_c0_g1_i1:24-1136(-)